MQEIVADLTYKMFNGDQQAISDFVRAEPNLAQRILEKIKEFIQTLTGNTQEPNEMQKRLQKAQELFEQALKDREHNSGHQSGKAQFDIYKSTTGNSYVKAYRPISNSNKADAKSFKTYMRQLFLKNGPTSFESADGEILWITDKTAEHSPNGKGINSDYYDAKLNADAHLDELIQTAEDNAPDAPIHLTRLFRRKTRKGQKENMAISHVMDSATKMQFLKTMEMMLRNIVLLLALVTTTKREEIPS